MVGNIQNCASMRKETLSNRLTDAEIMKIYMDCIDFAGTLSREKAEKVAEMALALDRLNDISELMNILTFPKK